MILKKASEGTPRPGDLERTVLLKRASEQIALGHKVYFKFTCAYCGERCTLSQANVLYERGDCYKCHNETIIDCGGFLLAISVP